MRVNRGAAIALAFCHLDEIRHGWTEEAGRSFTEAEVLQKCVTSLDPDHRRASD